MPLTCGSSAGVAPLVCHPGRARQATTTRHHKDLVASAILLSERVAASSTFLPNSASSAA